MNIRKFRLVLYLRLIKTFFNLKIGAIAPVKNLHYYLVTNFFRAWPIEVNSHAMFLHLHDSIISSRLLWHGSFEQDETDFMKTKIKGGGYRS